MATLPSHVDDHVLQRYKIEDKLGKGAYGIVWRAIDKETKHVVALKKIFDAFQNPMDAQRTFREVKILQALNDHENIIKLLNVLPAANGKDLYVVFEYMEADLTAVIRANILTEAHKQYVMCQLLQALKFMHSGGWIHRDLKPSNLLLDSDCVTKLCDFGLARSVWGTNADKEAVMTDYVATRWYRAPEILLGSTHYTYAIDMWAVGCIMGELLLNKPLFPGASTTNQLERVLQLIGLPTPEDIASVRSPYAEQIIESISNVKLMLIENVIPNASADCLDFLKQLLQFNPDKRMTVEQAISHPYLAAFRNIEKERVMPGPLFLEVDDNLRLSVVEYRVKLYKLADSTGVPADVLHEWELEAKSLEVAPAPAIVTPAVAPAPIPSPALAPSPTPTKTPVMVSAEPSPKLAPSPGPSIQVSPSNPSPATSNSPQTGRATSNLTPEESDEDIVMNTPPAQSRDASLPEDNQSDSTKPLDDDDERPDMESMVSPRFHGVSDQMRVLAMIDVDFSNSKLNLKREKPPAIGSVDDDRVASRGSLGGNTGVMLPPAPAHKKDPRKNSRGGALEIKQFGSATAFYPGAPTTPVIDAWIAESPAQHRLSEPRSLYSDATDQFDDSEDVRNHVCVTSAPQADQVLNLRRESSTSLLDKIEVEHSMILKACKCWERLAASIAQSASNDSFAPPFGGDFSYVPDLNQAVFLSSPQGGLDSLAACIACAYMYNGTSSRPGDLTEESKFALDKWSVAAPPVFECFVTVTKVVLVGHRLAEDVNRAVKTDHIVGLIDHHTVGEGALSITHPVFMDIRPWGSTSAIVAHILVASGKRIPPKIAGLLLSGILADTLNMRSPATSDWDGKIVSMLTRLAQVPDIDILARQQFLSKCVDSRSLSICAVVSGDLEVYNLKSEKVAYRCGISILETPDPSSIISRQSKIFSELRFVKVELGLSLMFFVLVDSTKRTAEVMICGIRETSLAEQSFGGKADRHWLHLGSKTSRSRDILPALQLHISLGWKPPTKKDQGFPSTAPPMIVGSRTNGFVVRKGSSDEKRLREEGSSTRRIRLFKSKWSPWR